MTESTPLPSPKSEPGVLALVLPGIVLAALFSLGVSAFHGLVDVCSGSYVALAVAAMVGAFWMAVAAGAAVAVAAVFLPVLIMLRGRWRSAILPGLIVAAAFLANAFAFRRAIVNNVPLGTLFMLRGYGLVPAALVMGGLTAFLAVHARRTGAWTIALFMLMSILFATGLSYFVLKPAGAFTLLVGPLALASLGVLLLERIVSARRRAALVFVAAVIFAVALLVSARVAGEPPLAPVNMHFRPDPGKTAMLAGKPNLIIITLDTVRADHTSLCGYKYPTTPNLVRLASECRFFPCGESVDSWTLPAHASMFTGKYPREHGAHASPERTVSGMEKGFTPCGIPLAPSQVTLAALLSMKGYSTGAIVANYSWLCRQYGLDQGFSYYYDLPRWLVFTPGGSPVYEYGLEAVDTLLGKNGKLLETCWDARSVTRMAESWISENRRSPFFLFLNYMDPHYPYCAVPPFHHIDGPDVAYNDVLSFRNWQTFISRYMKTGEGMTPKLAREISNAYDGEIAYLDHWVGQLADWLKAEGLYDDTLLVITSDHGEFFGEHRLLNHGVGLYEGGLRIPILVKYPRGRFAGEVRNERVSIMDIFATVFEVLEFPMPECSAVPLGAPARELLYAEDFENGTNVERFGERFRGDRTAAFRGDWKYLSSTAAPGELYNLAVDPDEENELSGAEPSVAGALGKGIRNWQDSTPLFDGTKEARREISQGELEKLRSLGYLGGAK